MLEGWEIGRLDLKLPVYDHLCFQYTTIPLVGRAGNANNSYNLNKNLVRLGAFACE